MYHQGEIYFANLNPTLGSEQSWMRPVVIISGESFNNNKDLVIVCPATSKIKNYYGDLVLQPNASNGLDEQTEILWFQIRTITTSRLGKKVWFLNDSEVKNILSGIHDILTY